MNLRQRIRLVRHVGELRLVFRIFLHVLSEHGLSAVVPIPRPVEHLQAPTLLGELRTSRLGQAGATREQAGAARRGRQLEEVFTAQPPFQHISAVVHRVPLLPLPSSWAD